MRETYAIDLLKEARTIQQHLNGRTRKINPGNADDTTRRFADLMTKGNVKTGAATLLADKSNSGLLPLHGILSDSSAKTVGEALEENHPDSPPV